MNNSAAICCIMPSRKRCAANTESSAASEIVTGNSRLNSLKRACTLRHEPQIRTQPAVPRPHQTFFSDLLTIRSWPAGHLGFGTSITAADCRNSFITLDGWKQRTFKETIRRYARANQALQVDNPTKYGSAFVSYGSYESKGRLYRLGSSAMLGSDKCRTMHRFSNNNGSLELRILYPEETSNPQPVELKTFTNNLLVVERNIDDKPSFDDEFAAADWTSPLNNSCLLLTTEATAAKESVIRIAALETGEVLQYIWLSKSLSFKAFDRQYGVTRFSCSAAQDLPGSAGGRCVVVFWDLHPFRYKGGVSFTAAVFGKDLTAVDVNDDIFMTHHTNGKIRVHSFLPFVNSKLRKPVNLGEPWDFSVYQHSTWSNSLGTPPSRTATYGGRGSGMPVTFYFTERPPVLYEVQSDQSYFTLALKQHLVLVVDKKLKEPVLINVASGDRKTGRVYGATEDFSLQTVDDSGQTGFEARNVLVATSSPERLVIWNGQKLCFYGVQEAECRAKFVLRQHFAAICPDVKISKYTEQFWTCEHLSYSTNLNAVLVVFGLGETRLLYIIDAVDGSVLSLTNLPSYNYATTSEEVEVDECGLTYYRQFDNHTNSMDFYALQDVSTCCD